MNQDFVDRLRAFVAHDVRFLIVGAYALALHGRPRATGDLIESDPARPHVLACVCGIGYRFDGCIAQTARPLVEHASVDDDLAEKGGESVASEPSWPLV